MFVGMVVTQELLCRIQGNLVCPFMCGLSQSSLIISEIQPRLRLQEQGCMYLMKLGLPIPGWNILDKIGS